jgi:hypothetical protein
MVHFSTSIASNTRGENTSSPGRAETDSGRLGMLRVCILALLSVFVSIAFAAEKSPSEKAISALRMDSACPSLETTAMP